MVSNEHIQKIAIGTVQFGLAYGISNQHGQTGKQEAKRILDVALKHGITTLDTAQEYGESEQVLGEIHGHHFDIVTKVKLNTTDLSVQELVPKSYERMGVETLYGMLYHNEVSLRENPESLKYLIECKQQGKLKKLGYTGVTSPEVFERLINQFGLPDIVQVPYSLLDRRFENLLKQLHEQGVEIHTRSAFLQGLFFLSPDKLHPHFDAIKPFLEALSEKYPTASEKAAALLSFVLEKPFIDKAVIGLNNAGQLESNINHLKTVEEIDLALPESVSDEILMPNLWPSN